MAAEVRRFSRVVFYCFEGGGAGGEEDQGYNWW